MATYYRSNFVNFLTVLDNTLRSACPAAASGMWEHRASALMIFGRVFILV